MSVGCEKFYVAQFYRCCNCFPKNERKISIQFFQKVRNKIHYAIQGQTAAEVIVL